MAWDFETDPAFQTQLDWIDGLMRSRIEPLDHILGSPYDVADPKRNALVRPLQAEVRAKKLWACHLGPELGGQGYGQVKLALMNEILGRSRFGPTVFGCQAPDTGNAEILAHYGTAAQKKKFLEPLLANEIVSCFSITEPQGGADPKVFRTRAERQGNDWVINGQKWFASNARFAAFLIVMAITDPDAASPYKRMSMFIIPAGTPGMEIVRNVGFHGEAVDTHAYVDLKNVRVPAENMLGGRGEAFVVAQTRLGGGRIHHAMRTIGEARRALDMMCTRVLSRETQGQRLWEKQMVQEKIADSWVELEQFRLLVLRTAWLIDKHKDYKKVRKDISAVKAAMPRVLHDIAARALHIHGSLGISKELPLADLVMQSFHVGLADGPTEVHKATLVRELLKDYQPENGIFPSYHLPALEERARQLYGDTLEDLQEMAAT
jgi:acyl-CoA dehydrogenase